jgi:hypothetical protein
MKSRCVPPSGGSVTELSVTEYCRGRAGDQMILQRRNADLVVNFAHFGKINLSRTRRERHAGGAGILIIRKKIRKVVLTALRDAI